MATKTTKPGSGMRTTDETVTQHHIYVGTVITTSDAPRWAEKADGTGFAWLGPVFDHSKETPTETLERFPDEPYVAFTERCHARCRHLNSARRASR